MPNHYAEAILRHVGVSQNYPHAAVTSAANQQTFSRVAAVSHSMICCPEVNGENSAGAWAM